jgi:hypothetical protein
MDFAGFTDYDYDQIVSVLNNDDQKITLNYFYADSKQKTVYDVLREAFMAYQIGAYIDEYGVMKFTNIQNIITNNVSTYTIEDKNIEFDSYSEDIKTKIGKIV